MEESEYPTLYLDEEPIVVHSPEKVLLAAILEMAYRDLKPYVSREIKRKAIAWFKSDFAPENFPIKFTFKQIISELELSAADIKYIDDAVEEALLYDKMYYSINGNSDIQRSSGYCGYKSKRVPRN